MKRFYFYAITLMALAAIFAAMPCLAQQTGMVSFNYDANGNRIMRLITLGSASRARRR